MNAPGAALASLFALWFWQRTTTSAPPTWPDDLPRFTSAPAHCTYTPSDGSVFAHVTVPLDRPAAHASLERAFAEEGWRGLSVRTADMLLFTRQNAVAAVYTAATDVGTRITVILRRDGLTPKTH
jgi:hypothetical protein